MPLGAAEVDVRGAGWRIKKLKCPCFNDTRQKIQNPRCINSSLVPPLKDSVIQSLETWGSPADVPVALPVLAACCLAKPPVLKERVFQGVSQHQPLGGFVLQHAFNEVKQLVVLLRLRQQVPLTGERMMEKRKRKEKKKEIKDTSNCQERNCSPKR